MLETYLEPLPKNSSFIINIVTNYATHTAVADNFKQRDFFWIVDENVNKIQNGLLIPIINFETDYLILHCYAVQDRSSKMITQKGSC